MHMNRREFLQVIGIAAASGLALHTRQALAGDGDVLYDVPRMGNVSLLHMTDCHAQLLPIYFREPSANIGIGQAAGRPPHLVGEYFLKFYNMKRHSRDSYAFTYLDYADAARTYGKMGGFAHLKTLVDRLKASRPGALLLDGGDTWQGSATALWSNAQDMVDAGIALGVNVMTPHWEMTYGAERVTQVVNGDFKKAGIDFVAQNIHTNDFGDQVFKPYVMKEINGVQVAIIGQAFPYTPIAHPRRFVPDWTFGIKQDGMQKWVNEAREKGAQAVIVLSHNGMDVDLKMASLVSGIDFILGGHTHDGVPHPVPVKNPGGVTYVTNAGSNGKFLGVLDLDVKGGKVTGWQYKLLPVFSNLLPADPSMSQLIQKVRAPYDKKLAEKLAVTEDVLYRRGNFNGTFDQVILDALMKMKDAEVAFSPGFRWGTSLLPGDTITMERLMDQTGITYPYTTVSEFTGEQIKGIMEDICDNLFNPDPYYQQGGDMVRVGGISYTVDPAKLVGHRISNMMLKGKPVDPKKTYKVAGWAPVGDNTSGAPIWDVVGQYLRETKTIKHVKANQPKVIGIGAHNPGIAPNMI